MGWELSEARLGLRGCIFGLTAIAAVSFIASDTADARRHRHARIHVAHHTAHSSHHRSAETGYSPPSASIVVDGNTGRVLQESNPDAPRHPASLTKIMTLYMLFERLDSGKIKLDSPLRVSQHAAEQSPTKLGLKTGATIAVEDAIKGVVTRSANDAAVVIAENLGGDEDSFARMMTQKAHALGMSGTTYVNASGLPADEQITTARDQSTLGRAIQERFPVYYKYFSTRSFNYHGESIGNHNHLLGSVEGVDGIKTGFTHASGFNLVTSLHRDGRYMVAVVLGGRSSFERDAHMRELIAGHIREAALRRSAPMVAEHQQADPQAVAFAKAPMSTRGDSTPTASLPPAPATRVAAAPAPAAALAPAAAPAPAARIAAAAPATTPVAAAAAAPATAPVAAAAATGSSDPMQPLQVKTISYRIAPVQPSSLAPMPSLVTPAASPAAQVSAAKAAMRPQLPAAQADAAPTVVATAEPSMAGIAAPAKAEPAKEEVARVEFTKVEPVKAEPAKLDPPRAELPRSEPEPAPVRAHGGWLIQIGAFDAEDEAKQHLSAARTKLHAQLAAADPFTERVQKGDKQLYRARFAGFDKETAEATCKQLKRNDFECMALKN